MTVREAMKADLMVAMKQRQADKVSALRSLLSAIDNAESVPVDDGPVPITGFTADVPRRHLTEEDIAEILRSEADERTALIAEYERRGRDAKAAELSFELQLIDHYLQP